MVITGKPSLDDLVAHIDDKFMNKVRDDLFVSKNSRLVAFSVPPFYEIGFLSWEDQKKDILYIINRLSELNNVTVAISLHPRCKNEDYMPLFKQSNFTIYQGKIYSLIKACDIFITNHSSTVSVACELNISVVIYDFHGVGYDIYNSMNNVQISNNYSDFSKDLSLSLSQGGDKINTNKINMAMLDGRCNDRILKEIYSLAS